MLSEAEAWERGEPSKKTVASAGPSEAILDVAFVAAFRTNAGIRFAQPSLHLKMLMNQSLTGGTLSSPTLIGESDEGVNLFTATHRCLAHSTPSSAVT